MRVSAPGFQLPAKVTLDAVAERAGVSRATVSRVVNDSPKVSTAVRAAVEEAIEVLGYVPNRAARSLVTKRADTIALVVSEPGERLFSDPFFAGIIRGISDELAHTDYMFVLLTAQGGLERVARYVRSGRADGLILMSLHGDDPALFAAVERGRIPTVVSGRPLGSHKIPYVDADNRAGARSAVEYLITSGRKRICTIAGPQEMSAGVDRLDGYIDAMNLLPAAMRRSTRKLTEFGDFTEDSGEDAMRALLRRVPDLDAVFVANDLMAAGALRVLKTSGRKIPHDVAVIGFDDSITARHTSPALSSVRQPVEEMGRQLALQLLAQLRNPGLRREPVILPTELVVREST